MPSTRSIVDQRSPSFAVDSSARTELWLAYQHERNGRRSDAESIYSRVMPKLAGPGKTFVRNRLRSMWADDKNARLNWAPSPARPLLRAWSEWNYRPEAVWIIGLTAFLVLHVRTRRAGWTQLRVKPFTRNLSANVGLGIEETIADFHRKTREVSSPLGVIVHSGLKLPVVSSARPDPFLQVIELFSPPSWLPRLWSWAMSGADKPRFLIQGHVAGNEASVRIVAHLQDSGQEVRSWDHSAPAGNLLALERTIACEIIFAVSERSS